MHQSIVVALFDELDVAKNAVRNLILAGVPRREISLLANSPELKDRSLITNSAFAKADIEDAELEAATDLETGTEVGLGLGGLVGLLVGVGIIAIPGIGPIVAAGTGAAMLAGIGTGAVVGGLAGALMGKGVSREDAHLYAEGLKRGGTLIVVHIPTEKIVEIRRLLNDNGSADTETRGAEWRANGWVSFREEPNDTLA